MPLSNLVKRVLSAAVVLALVRAITCKAPPWGLALLVLLVTVIGLFEISAMTLPGDPAWHRQVTIAVGTALAAGLYFAPSHAGVIVPLAMVAVGSLVVLRPGAIETSGPRLAAATLGVIYVGCLAPCLALLGRDVAAGQRWVVLALLTTAANDTGAYFAGRAF